MVQVSIAIASELPQAIMIKKKMKDVRSERESFLRRWKRGTELIVAAENDRKALKVAAASAAKKANHEAAAKKRKDDANEKAAAQAKHTGAAHLRSSAANVSNEDGTMKQIFDQALMCITKSRRSEERRSYQSSWQRQKRQLQQKMAPVTEKKMLQEK